MDETSRFPPRENVQEIDEVGEAVAVDVPRGAGDAGEPAAHLHSDVLRSPAEGGYQNPWTLDAGLETPGLFHARYPSQKTQIVEHNWNQSPPDACNPSYEFGTYAGCEPYWFNHGLASAPATLLYDLSVRVVPNAQPFAADRRHMEATGEGLWSRDTPFGANGYRIDIGFDGAPLSHHILTMNGILGRDFFAVPEAALTIWGE